MEAVAIRHNSHLLWWAGRLAISALILAACAAPATLAPTPTPTVLPPTATAIPPTAVPSTSTPAGPVAARATSIRFDTPLFGLAVDADGNLYLSTCTFGTGSGQIFKVDRYGLLSVFAGTDVPGFSGDGGPARSAQFQCVTGLAFDHQGNLNFADNYRIRRIDHNGIITTVAGSGPVMDPTGNIARPIPAGDGGPATSALLDAGDIAFDLADNLYFNDQGNGRIRKVDKQGIITTVAGTSADGFSGDGGPAAAAQLMLSFAGPSDVFVPLPAGLAADALGQIYIADSGNGRVRKIDQQGVITTIAGADGPVVSGDGGLATAAVLAAPVNLAFDAAGNLYVGDAASASRKDYRIRKVDQKGILTTVVGTGHFGFSGDGGPVTAADITTPGAMILDGQGNLYFIDFGNQRVRKVDTKGIITTVAGGAP